MSMVKKIVLFVILVCLISLSTLTIKGFCDEWVYVDTYPKTILYYNSSSITIDKQMKTIKVWAKSVFHRKAMVDITPDIIRDLGQADGLYDCMLILYLFDYKLLNVSINHIAGYTKTGVASYKDDHQTKWTTLIPDSTGDRLLKKLFKDYKLQR